MSIGFIILAAFFNAIMDVAENENANSSILKNLNPKFWHKRVSWQHAKRVFGYKFDAWHIAKTLMIVSLILAVYFYEPLFGLYDILFMGIAWNVSFNSYYSMFTQWD